MRTALLALLLAFFVRPAAAQSPAADGDPVAVAAHDLERGATLSAEDVQGDAAALVGWVTRRMVARGEPLRAPAVAPPNLVTSGEVVQAVWAQGGIELRIVGRAMSSGARGDRVYVRVDSRRRFAGVVIDRALVRIEAGDTER